MKSKRKVKYLIISIVSVILIIVSIFLVLNKNKEVKVDIKNNKMFAIMVEKNINTKVYQEYRENSNWPNTIGTNHYKFSKAECYDKQRKEIKDENIIEYDAFNGQAIMRSRKSAFCTLYFDIDNDAPESGSGAIEISSIYKNGDKKYTSISNPEIIVKIQEEDIMAFCVKVNEKNTNNCNWQRVTNETIRTREYTITDNKSGDGEKTVYLHLKDNAGNISESTEEDLMIKDSIILDKTNPTLTVTNKENGNNYNGSWTKENVISSLAFSDSGSGINTESLKWKDNKNTTTWQTISNSSTTGYTSVDNNTTWSGEGERKGYYQICDNVNNCKEVNFDLKIDKTAPSCSIGGNPSSWQNTNATLTQNGEDTREGTVYYSWDNENSYSTTKSNKTASANGTYTLYVKDGLGNKDNCSVSVTKIDKTKPTITFTLDGQTAKYTCTDNTGGSGIPSGKESGSYALTGTSNYTYTVSTCVDNAGNGADNNSHIYTYGVISGRDNTHYVEETCTSCNTQICSGRKYVCDRWMDNTQGCIDPGDCCRSGHYEWTGCRDNPSCPTGKNCTGGYWAGSDTRVWGFKF